MTTERISYRRQTGSAMGVAVRLGLLWQAAFSVVVLRHYVRHGSSVYLSNIAGAWPYVHQHLLWIGAFVALGLGARGLARALAAGAALLAAVGVVSLAEGASSFSPGTDAAIARPALLRSPLRATSSWSSCSGSPATPSFSRT